MKHMKFLVYTYILIHVTINSRHPVQNHCVLKPSDFVEEDADHQFYYSCLIVDSLKLSKFFFYKCLNIFCGKCFKLGGSFKVQSTLLIVHDWCCR